MCIIGDMNTIYYDKETFQLTVKMSYSQGLFKQLAKLPGFFYDKPNQVIRFPVTPQNAERLVAWGNSNHFMISSEVMAMCPTRHVTRQPIEGLFPYQREGVDFLHKNGGRVLLADDMGLGKTVETIAYLYEARVGRTLIVCPASVVYKWQDEIRRWYPGEVTVTLVTSTSGKIKPADFTIMSYGIMTRLVKKLPEYECVVLDEAHYISNNKSQRSKAARQLRTIKMLMLSGTPFLNRPIELYPLLDCLQPRAWGSFFQFGHRYAGAVHTRFGWDFSGATNLNELRSRLSSTMLRRTKKEVLAQLPELTRTYLPINITNAPEYYRVSSEFRTWLQGEGREASTSNKLTKITALRCVLGRGKVEAAIELAQDILAGGDQVVLYAVHKEVVTSIVYALQEHGVVTVVGEDSQEQRADNVNKFQSGIAKVAVISQAGGEGINLYSASHIIFVEREWNSAKEEQAEARLHRIGQKQNVTAYYLVARGTYDERLNQMVEHKRKISGEVFKHDDIEVILSEV